MRIVRVSAGSLERITWVFSLCTLLALGYLATPSPSFAWQEGPNCQVDCQNYNPQTDQRSCSIYGSSCQTYAIFCYCGEVEEVEYVPVCECAAA